LAEERRVNVFEVLKKYLAESTAIRRKSNIIFLLRKIKEYQENSMKEIFSNIEGV
jgi:hypothetical protein